ncbi:hypothetical protein RchiOBHm_Chr6g0303251 [Rosa chinensis]|uniref:Uncharacterized protein n=1 Tax=Rosa chinensis TaxID=74649 RepID=A0A2P6PZ87_ROSCH|nr:hypothetical protein RchiOBHm_Chr6g0303251 [Rosa chinensis]
MGRSSDELGSVFAAIHLDCVAVDCISDSDFVLLSHHHNFADLFSLGSEAIFCSTIQLLASLSGRNRNW